MTKTPWNFSAWNTLYVLEPGIHKPFDHIAKEFAEEAPLLFLRILGIAGPSDDIRLEPLREETAPPMRVTDYVATLHLPGQDPYTFHVEFYVHYRDWIPSKIARYGGSLAWQYQRPVKSVLFLLKPEGVPEVIPEFGEYAIGETRLTHPLRTVKLWELDPQPVLDYGNPGLLPWALLMQLGREEAARLGALVSESGNEEWIARFLTLGSLRYDRSDLQQMLGGPRMGLVEAIMEGSSLVQEWTEKAEARGLATGLEKGLEKGLQTGLQTGLQEGKTAGKAEQTRELLRMALSRKYPGLETMPEIDRITNIGALESILLDRVMAGEDRASIERAILAGASECGIPQ